MSSLWNRSGTVERYADDIKAAGAQAFFFAGGTTTPFTVYHDAGGSSAHTNPVVADAFGRWPDVFVPYTLGYDVQVKTAEGVQLTYTQNIPNPDPVSLTVTPDPLADVTTGMIHGELINATKPGYVRLNGRTMGNGASSGTERANADTSALFAYLWNNLPDALAPVSSGRGANAAGDFAANKTITLPNCQGAALIGLDDMGSAAGGFFAGLSFDSGNGTTPASHIGSNSVTLSLAQIPAHSHSGTTAQESPAHFHTGTTGNQSADHTHAITAVAAHQHSAFIGDDGHTHTSNANINNGTFVVTGNTIVATYSSAAAATINSATTGVKVRSTAGNAATADSQTAAAGAHDHGGATGIQSASHTHSFTTATGAHSHTFTTDIQGSSQSFNNIPRAVTVTWFIHL